MEIICTGCGVVEWVPGAPTACVIEGFDNVVATLKPLGWDVQVLCAECIERHAHSSVA